MQTCSNERHSLQRSTRQTARWQTVSLKKEFVCAVMHESQKMSPQRSKDELPLSLVPAARNVSARLCNAAALLVLLAAALTDARVWMSLQARLIGAESDNESERPPKAQENDSKAGEEPQNPQQQNINISHCIGKQPRMHHTPCNVLR